MKDKYEKKAEYGTSYLKPTFTFNRPRIERAEGVFIYDENGRDYLDGSGGAMTVSIGHGVNEVLEAMRTQASKACFAYRTQFTSEAAEELAKALTSLAPKGITHAFFVNSGSEGTELAMRTAMQYWRELGKPRKASVLGQNISYHGMTMGALSMSGHRSRRRDYGELLHPFAVGGAPYLDRSGSKHFEPNEGLVENWEHVLKDYGSDRVAAVIVEPIVGAAGGVLTPPPGYLKALRDICTRNDVLLIVDEVVTGMGRTGTWFACEHEDVVPDILVTAKGMSSGYTPMGATLLNEHIVKVMQTGSGLGPSGHTFSANPLSAATCLAVIKYMQRNNVLENVRDREKQLEAALHELSTRYEWMADVRGKGLLWGFDIVTNHAARSLPAPELKVNERLVECCFQAGLIAYPAGIAPSNNSLILCPPLVISQAETDTLVERLEAGMRLFQRNFKMT